MSLAHDAAADLREIINSDVGALWICTIWAPDGRSMDFNCRMCDTSQQIDPGTNQAVSGRQVNLAISMFDLECAGFSDIKAIEKKTEKPWKAITENIVGVRREYKIVESNPDASLGLMALHLELLK